MSIFLRPTGSIYAHSSRLMNLDGYSMPYAWNHTISYDQSLGVMPYLVQTLTTDSLSVDLMEDSGGVTYSLECDIRPGERKYFSQ